MKLIRPWSLLVVAACLISTAANAAIVFPNAENFNVMNSDTVQVTAFNTSNLSALPPSVLIMHQEAAWDGGPNPGGPGNFNQLTINFNTPRNIKTIRTYEGFGGFGLATATVETSNDGVNWTPRSNTASIPNVANTLIVLDNAATAQYLRITPTQMQASGAAQNNRWIIGSLRVFGDTGSLTTDIHEDVVSSTAYAASPGLTMTFNGSVSITDTTNAEFVDDRQNSIDPLERQVLFSMGTNDGFTLAFNQPIAFDRFAFNYATSGEIDLNADYEIATSPDGINFTPVATGTNQVHGPNFVELANSIGTHLRFTYTSTTVAGNRISDFMVFEPIPEPATGILMALSMAALFRLVRRRRTK